MNIQNNELTLNELLTLPREAITRVLSDQENIRIDFT